MKIIINEKNMEKIARAIEEAEGKATARTISAGIVKMVVDDITKKLGIPKKDMVGIKAEIDYNAQKLPNAYKYAAYSTHFSIEGCASGWALTGVWRGCLWQRNGSVQMTLTDDAKRALIGKYELF